MMHYSFCWFKKNESVSAKTREKATQQKREREREKRENFLSVVPFYMHECTYLTKNFFLLSYERIYIIKALHRRTRIISIYK